METAGSKMLLKIFSCAILILLSVVSNAYADGTICFDQNNAFAVSAPKGWQADFKMAKNLGLCVVFFPAGKFTFDTAPAVFYPNLVTTTDELEAFIASDLETFKRQSKKIKIEEQPNMGKKAFSFVVRKTSFGAAPNEFELIAYHQADRAILVAALSMRTAADQKKYSAKFAELIGGIKQIPKKDLYGAFRKLAKDFVKTKEGKELDSKFPASVGEKLATATTECAKPGDTNADAVAVVSESGEITEWINKTDDNVSQCIRKKMKGTKGVAPGSLAYLPFDIKITP
jgi:hypothetical protein